MRAGAVQLNSTEDTDRNLATADRLVREAVSLGAELVVLPEKWTVLGTAEQMSAAAEPLDGRFISWARELAAELEIDLIAGSIVERVEGQAKSSNTSVHVGPDGEIRAVYRKLHMFDVEVDGVTYAESRSEQPGDEVVVSELADGSPLGMSICYDIRFPELYRALVDKRRRGDLGPERVHAGDDPRPLGGAGPGARDREPVLRGRAQPDRRAPARQPLGRALADRRPVGPRARERAGHRDRDRRRSRLRQPAGDPAPPARAHPPASRRVHGERR